MYNVIDPTVDGFSSEIPDDYYMSDQRKGLDPPPLQKPHDPQSTIIDLVPADSFTVGQMTLVEVMRKRKSHRSFTDTPLSLEELSFLCWSIAGVQEVHPDRVWTKRTVPSAGARHPFETYLVVSNVTDLSPGLYRYLPLSHQLVLEADEGDSSIAEKYTNDCLYQAFGKKAAVIFAWTTIPYRKEWRYGSLSHKVVAIDVGHLCQNLYLAVETIGSGTCAIASYNQERSDQFLGVDGKEEFTIYVAPVGKIIG